MSPDQPRLQIDKPAVAGSRDRWRPPDLERESRPDGNRAGDLENTSNDNSNASSSRTKRQSLQALRDAELRRLRRQRVAAIVWGLGARAFFEFMDELDRHFEIPDLDRQLERYANVDTAALRLLGGDRFPASPIRAAGGGR